MSVKSGSNSGLSANGLSRRRMTALGVPHVHPKATPHAREYVEMAFSPLHLWPWHLSPIRKHFVQQTPDWDDVIHFTAPQKDGLRRYLTSSIIAWSNFSFLLGVSSAASFIISNELYFNYVVTSYDRMCTSMFHPETDVDVSILRLIVLFQIVLTILTLVLGYARFKYYESRYRRRILSGKILPGVSLIQSNLGGMFVLDFTLCLFHCPPALQGCFTAEHLLGPRTPNLSYHVQLISIAALLRIFLFLPAIIHCTRFETESVKHLIKLHNVKRAQILGFRDVLWRFPATLVMLTYFTSIFFFAYILMAFERAADFTLHFGALANDSYWSPTYSTCLWFCWAVQSTVGLGDWYPLTYAGRVIAVLSNVMGMIATAMLISAVVSKFKLSSEEQKLVFTIDWLARKRRIPNSAAALIQLWYRSKVQPSWLPAFSSALLEFKTLRKKLKSEHPSDDMAVSRELLSTVRSLSENLKETKADVRDIKRLLASIAPPLTARENTVVEIDDAKNKIIDLSPTNYSDKISLRSKSDWIRPTAEPTPKNIPPAPLSKNSTTKPASRAQNDRGYLSESFIGTVKTVKTGPPPAPRLLLGPSLPLPPKNIQEEETEGDSYSDETNGRDFRAQALTTSTENFNRSRDCYDTPQERSDHLKYDDEIKAKNPAGRNAAQVHHFERRDYDDTRDRERYRDSDRDYYKDEDALSYSSQHPQPPTDDDIQIGGRSMKNETAPRIISSSPLPAPRQMFPSSAEGRDKISSGRAGPKSPGQSTRNIPPRADSSILSHESVRDRDYRGDHRGEGRRSTISPEHSRRGEDTGDQGWRPTESRRHSTHAAVPVRAGIISDEDEDDVTDNFNRRPSPPQGGEDGRRHTLNDSDSRKPNVPVVVRPASVSHQQKLLSAQKAGLERRDYHISLAPDNALFGLDEMGREIIPAKPPSASKRFTPPTQDRTTTPARNSSTTQPRTTTISYT